LEIFLYGRENLAGVLGFLFLKNPSKLKKIDPQNPSLNTPLVKIYEIQKCVKFQAEILKILKFIQNL